MVMAGFLVVFLGGGFGAAIRHAVNLTFARLIGTAIPATIFENITGSLAMGIVAGYFAFKSDTPQHWVVLNRERDCMRVLTIALAGAMLLAFTVAQPASAGMRFGGNKTADSHQCKSGAIVKKAKACKENGGKL
jgi:hypothetical protein